MNNYSKALSATYGMIKSFKNHKLTYWLALGEFIDNSISSWQNGDEDKNMHGLVINIEINTEDHKNKKITIQDNANGMNAEELMDAMQPSNTFGKKDTQYNQYGVGMKSGIFWLGRDGKIISRKNNETHYVDFITSDKDDAQEVVISCLEMRNSEDIKDNGTKIIISHVFDNRNIWTKNNLELTKDALGWRYNKLIKNGMKINIHTICADKKGEGDQLFEVVAFENTPFQLEDFKKILLSKMKNKSPVYKRESINKEINKIKKRYEELIESGCTDELKIEAYRKFINNEKLFFEKDINFNYNKKATLFFGVSNRLTNKNKYEGLTTYHIQRAINHGPNEREREINNISFWKSGSGTTGRTEFRRLYGEINLTGIQAPDQNKSRFDWTDENEDILRYELKRVFDSLEELLDKITDIEQLKTIKEANDKKQIIDIKKDISPKLDFCNLKEREDEDGNFCLNVDIKKENLNEYQDFIEDDGNINFNIREDSNLLGKIFEIRNIDGNKFDFLWNQNHDFWKPLLNNKDMKLRGQMIYPFFILITTANSIFKKMVDVKDGVDENEFFNILNSILEKKKYNE